MTSDWKGLLAVFCMFVFLPAAYAQATNDYQLAAGDTIRIVVYQNPDLTLDTRISENGTITYPLVGSLSIGGLAIAVAAQ